MTMPLPYTDLGGKRIGVIGAPSDWLISSGVDYAKAKDRLNVEMVDNSFANHHVIIPGRLVLKNY